VIDACGKQRILIQSNFLKKVEISETPFRDELIQFDEKPETKNLETLSL
jgi:hypothetical protein